MIVSAINPEIKGSDSSQNHRCFMKNDDDGEEDFSNKKPETKSFKCTEKGQVRIGFGSMHTFFLANTLF